MKKLWNSLLFLLIIIPGMTFARQMTVNGIVVPVRATIDSTEVVTNLNIGMKVELLMRTGEYAQVSSGQIKGWVDVKSLTPISLEFSNVDEEIVLCDKIYTHYTHNNQRVQHYLIYYYNEQVNKLNIETRKIETSKRVGKINKIYPSESGDIILVEGMYTNESEVNNLKIFHLNSGNTINIGSFNYKISTLFSVKFSPDDRYFVLVFKTGNTRAAVVYSSATGNVLAFAGSIEGINWYKHNLIIHDKVNFWNYNIKDDLLFQNLEYKETNHILTLKKEWLKDGEIDSELIDDNLLIQISGGVLKYNLINRELTKSPYKSLELDKSQIYNHYLSSEQSTLFNTRTGKVLSMFSGVKPRYRFVQFAGEVIIFQKTIEKVETFFLYDPNTGNEYRYKVIDDISAISSDGIIAETLNDKDLQSIAIEMPYRKEFFFIFIRGDEK